MPAGEAFTPKQQQDIQRTVSQAERESGLQYSVYVGALSGDSRAHAMALHAALGEDAPITVLLAIDPGNRRLEVVTGEEAAHQLDDRACTLAAMSMTTTFTSGDLSGGIVLGLQSLSQHAQRPRMLHTDTP